jgi:hypothetical protein
MERYQDETMSTGAWFLTLLVLGIPFVNLILYIVWACGVGNRNRVTFCRASILLTVIGFAIILILHLTGVAAVAALDKWGS